MDTTPRPANTRISFSGNVRRGLSAAGAAVVVAFVGTAGLGAGQASAAGVQNGLPYAAESTQRVAAPAAHPANLPAASTLAVRYVVTGRGLRQI